MSGKTNLKISVLVVAFSLAIVSSATARTIYVDDNGPADYDNIQAAIDAAVDGDEVVVAEGTYENISIDGKSITLRSTNPTNPDVVAATIIDGGGREPAVYFSGGGDYPCWTLSGFTITNAGGAMAQAFDVMPPSL
jgi:pectin methylesterase-like acyl-CoA thioesterase